jgi:hypothetical protein
MADSTAAELQELLLFVYLTPVGIVKFGPDGTVDLINPAASQLLLALKPDGDLVNLYDSLMPPLPDLRQRVTEFAGQAGAILNRHRFEVLAGGKALVASLTIHRVSESVYMALVEDVTMAVSQERKLIADRQRFRAIFNNVRESLLSG